MAFLALLSQIAALPAPARAGDGVSGPTGVFVVDEGPAAGTVLTAVNGLVTQASPGAATGTISFPELFDGAMPPELGCDKLHFHGTIILPGTPMTFIEDMRTSGCGVSTVTLMDPGGGNGGGDTGGGTGGDPGGGMGSDPGGDMGGGMGTDPGGGVGDPGNGMGGGMGGDSGSGAPTVSQVIGLVADPRPLIRRGNDPTAAASRVVAALRFAVADPAQLAVIEAQKEQRKAALELLRATDSGDRARIAAARAALTRAELLVDLARRNFADSQDERAKTSVTDVVARYVGQAVYERGQEDLARDFAESTRKTAKGYRELAEEARKNAEEAPTEETKEMWRRRADEHERRAEELENLAEERDRVADDHNEVATRWLQAADAARRTPSTVGVARQRIDSGLLRLVTDRVGDSLIARRWIVPGANMLAARLGNVSAEDLLRGAIRRLGGGNAGPVEFLAALFAEAIDRAEPKDRLALALLHAHQLAAVLNNAGLEQALGAGIRRDEIQASLDRVVAAIRDTVGAQARAATLAGDAAGDLTNLTTLLTLYTLPVSDPPDVQALFRDINRVIDQMTNAPGDPKEAVSALLRALTVVETYLRETAGAPVAPADYVRHQQTFLAASAALAEVATLLSSEARRAASAGGEGASQLTMIADEAQLTAARALIALGRYDEGLDLIRGLAATTPEQQAAKAAALYTAIGLIQSAYPGLSTAQRRAIDLAALQAERQEALRQWLKNETDPGRLVVVAITLARNLESAGDTEGALTVLGDASKRFDDPLLAAETLRMRIDLLGDSPDSEDVAALVEGVPSKRRAAVLGVAIEGLAASGNVTALDAIGAALGSLEGIPDAHRDLLRFQLAVAQVAAGLQQQLDDEAIERLGGLVAGALGQLPGLPLQDDVKDSLRATVEAQQATLDKIADWRDLVSDPDASPPEGFAFIAREALREGQFALAADALDRHLRTADSVDGFREVVTVLTMADKRLDDPALTPAQRGLVTGLIDRVKPGAIEAGDLILDQMIDDHERLAAARFGLIQAITDKDEIARQKAALAASTNGIQSMGRLTAAVRAVGVPDDQLGGILNTYVAELGSAADAERQSIVEGFTGLGESVAKGDMGVSLNTAISVLGARRAARDGAQDFALASVPFSITLSNPNDARSYGGFGSVLPATDPYLAALRGIDEDLNGYAPLRAGMDARAEEAAKKQWTNGARFEAERRSHDIIYKDDPNHRLTTMLVNDDVAYLFNRRNQLIFSDGYNSREEQRDLWVGLQQHDASIYGEFADVPVLLLPELTGIGAGEAARQQQILQGIVSFEEQSLLGDFELYSRTDPQRAFGILVKIRDRNLTGEVNLFVDYVDDDPTRRGTLRGITTALYAGGVRDEFGNVIRTEGALGGALLRASATPADSLRDEDKALLTQYGFLVNGQYRIPDGLILRPIDVGTRFVADTTFSADAVWNLRSSAQLFAEVVIPAGIASRVMRGTFTNVVASRFGGWLLERAGEGILLTGLTRFTRAASDPFSIDFNVTATDYLMGLGLEVVSNIAMDGVLHLYGAGSQAFRRSVLDGLATDTLAQRVAARTAREGLEGLVLVGEAGVQTFLNPLFSPSALTQDSFSANFAMSLMMRRFDVFAPPDVAPARDPRMDPLGLLDLSFDAQAAVGRPGETQFSPDRAVVGSESGVFLLPTGDSLPRYTGPEAFADTVTLGPEPSPSAFAQDADARALTVILPPPGGRPGPLSGTTITRGGDTLLVGNLFGRGDTADVYDLPGEPTVAKFIMRTDAPGFVASEAAKASDLLAERGIPQLRIVGVDLSGPNPILFAERLPEGWHFGPAMADLKDPARKAQVEAAGLWSPLHEQAVLDAYAMIAENNLVAFDLKPDNLAFKATVVDGEVVSVEWRISDHGMIAEWGNLGPFMSSVREGMELAGAKSGFPIWSLAGRPGTYEFADPMVAMTKALEYKTAIRFDPALGNFENGWLDINTVRADRRFNLDQDIFLYPDADVAQPAVGPGRGSNDNPFRDVVIEAPPDTQPGPATGRVIQNEGQTFLIGNLINGGFFADVYDIVGRSDVIKFIVRTLPEGAEEHQTPKEVAQQLVDASALLDAKRIPQFRITAHDLDAPVPWVMAEKVPEGWQFGPSPTDLANPEKRTLLEATGLWSKQHDLAVLDAYKMLAENDLVGLDIHPENLAYKPIYEDGRIVRVEWKLLDQGLIGEFGKLDGATAIVNANIEQLGANFDLFGKITGAGTVLSLTNRPRGYEFPNATVTMAKALEHKAAIRFDLGTGFEKGWMSPDTVREHGFFKIDEYIFITPTPPDDAGSNVLDSLLQRSDKADQPFDGLINLKNTIQRSDAAAAETPQLGASAEVAGPPRPLVSRGRARERLPARRTSEPATALVAAR